MIDFPCAVSGGMVATALKVNCDLNTYIYKEPFSPFIEIYGFKTSDWDSIDVAGAGIDLKIEIPKIKLRDDTGDSASITF